MAKIKSAGGTINHSKADARVYRRDMCMGDISNGDHTSISINSKPLSSFVESTSLRTTQRYDWQTGTVKTEHMDVLDNARRSMTTLHIRPVTNGRHMESDKPYGTMGTMGMAVPSSPLSRSRKNRGK